MPPSIRARAKARIFSFCSTFQLSLALHVSSGLAVLGLFSFLNMAFTGSEPLASRTTFLQSPSIG